MERKHVIKKWFIEVGISKVDNILHTRK